MFAKKIISNTFIARFTHNFSSALYITGDKAHNNFAVLTPHIDLDERYNDYEGLQLNIKARGLYIDLDSLERRWSFYLNLLDRKNLLSYTKSEISKEIGKLMEDQEKNKEELEKLKVHARILKDEYSTMKEFLYGVEESAALKALELPNVLHEKTPIGEENVIATFFEKPDHESKSHIEIGTEKKLIEHTNNSFVFLMNEAATFEYAIVNYAQSKLLDSSFTQFSNADFSKSVIVEGCGSNYADIFSTITLNDGNHFSLNRLHLTGGASHYAFMAYFTKYSMMPSQLPLKLFSAGRKYEPLTKDEPSLFNLVQQSAIELFSATKCCNVEMDKTFDEVVEKVIDIYKPLGNHFRLVLLPANKIDNYESLRLSIQMFSNSLKTYVEVGNVSICDTYLSKRLLFTYSENKERKFPKVITGNLINVQKLLACHIENNPDGELMCDLLKQYAPM
ncbi:PREDICTED: serine--tRNA synthetase-like protein Slimp [Nicrophorus vespilloides]|uniref:Serine--tRNA synthetase-like protein Slimp n=1 Tax=Nicrophorus vespilloides TaxID=110193 RepID=A0ABM1M221_NICVS|nr:PREDICTED: serine--tRNA synthetase-like protein Slimp [Nicrophorus vespilloides]